MNCFKYYLKNDPQFFLNLIKKNIMNCYLQNDECQLDYEHHKNEATST